MIPMTLKEIAAYTGGTLRGNPEDTQVSSIVTDSRKVVPGCLFVALRGEKFDGHQFVEQALQEGAVGAVVLSSYKPEGDGCFIFVEDTLLALGRIASGYLHTHFTKLRKIAVTGSVGKTSTKDMIAHVLSGKWKTCKTPMNFNNEIGLPMTLLGLDAGDEVLVSEMGMRGFGQIRYLTELVEQDLTVITNIGTSHLEILGSRENILRAKMEACFAGLGARMNKPYRLIVNGDNDLLQDTKLLKKIAKEYGCNHLVIIPFGFGAKCAYRATDVRMDGMGMRFTLWCDQGHFSVYLPLLGEHNVYNALAAICVGVACGLSVETAIQQLSFWGSDASRQRILHFTGVTVIDDTYNASPESMRASLGVLSKLPETCKIAVLGDMLELGSVSEESHLAIGELAGAFCEDLIAVGELAGGYCRGFSSVKGTETVLVDKAEAAVPELIARCKARKDLGETVAVLIKGSHSIHMERVTEGISAYLNS